MSTRVALNPINFNTMTGKPSEFGIGKLVSRTVSWFCKEHQSQLANVVKRIAACALIAFLALSIVGIPLLIMARREYTLLKSIDELNGATTRSDTFAQLSGSLPIIEKDTQKAINVNSTSGSIILGEDCYPVIATDEGNLSPEHTLTEEDLIPEDPSQLNDLGLNQFLIEAELKKFSPEDMFQELNLLSHIACKDQKFLNNNDEVLQRFTNIPCPADTAVKTEGSLFPYLHANFVSYKKDGLPKELLATENNFAPISRIVAQAPIGPGEHYLGYETQEQFWRAALDNTNVIVDLTRPIDNVKKYFADETYVKGTDLGQKTMGSITVTTKKITEMKYGIKVYHFHVKDSLTKQEKEITRIHYPNWEDFGGIETDSLEQIEYLYSLEKILNQKYEEQKPSITHCRAGVGRAGTYTVCSAMIELADAHLISKENRIELIKHLILAGRKQRGEVFVQSAEQLGTILELSKKLVEKGPSPAAFLDFSPEMNSLSEIDTDSFDSTDIGSKAAKEDEEILLVNQAPLKDPLKLVRELSYTGVNSKEDIKDLRVAIPLINKMNQKSKFKSPEEKEKIFKQLKKIKDGAGANWSSEYIILGSSSSSKKDNESSGIKLPQDLKHLINLTMNAIESNIPEYVKRHHAYHPNLILTDDPVGEAEKTTSEESLRIAKENGKTTNISYLYRDSSTHSGPKGIHTFTLTYTMRISDKENTGNVRFAYNEHTQAWQLAHECTGHYDVDSSSFVAIKYSEKLEVLKELFGSVVTFDQNGKVLNKFPSLEVLTNFWLLSCSPKDFGIKDIFPIRRK